MRHLPITAKATLSLFALGVLLHLYEVAQAESATDAGSLLFLGVFFLWSCLPYLVWTYVAVVKEKPVLAVGAASLIFVADLYAYYSVFIHPTRSTAALGLLFVPLWNLLLIGPAGAAISWLLTKSVQRFLHRAKHKET